MYDTVNMVRITGLNPEEIEERAKAIGIQLTDEHWDAIKFIKNFYDYHEDEELEVRDFNNAIKGKYADKGGLICQHFSGQFFKPFSVVLRNLLAINNHWQNVVFPCYKRLQYIQISPV